MSFEINVNGMSCSACVASIESHLRAQKGITDATVSLTLKVAKITSDLDPLQVCQMIEDLGFEATLNTTKSLTLKILGMTCAACSGTIQTQLSQCKGVLSVSVNLLGQQGCFEYDPSQIGVRDIVDRIEELGFDALVAQVGSNAQIESLARTREIQTWRRRFWTAFWLTLPVMLLSMFLPKTWENVQVCPGLWLNQILALCLTTPVLLVCARPLYISAFKALSHSTYTMDVLVVTGTSLAFAFSVFSMIHSLVLGNDFKPQVFFETAATLITFVTFGRYLENMAKAKTSSALAKLMSLAPPQATLLESLGLKMTERIIPVDYIKVNDLLKLSPGEKIPVDGIVELGMTEVDESLITGEPLPISKSIGSKVLAGTVNGTGMVHMRAVKVGSDTTLAHIVKLVSDAQTSKAPIQEVADRIAAVFVPSVLCLGAFTFVVWMVILKSTDFVPPYFPEKSDHVFICLSMAISVIMVACPCALGLATPTAVMVGTGVGASMGILIKGGGPLEAAHRVTKILFDKTGTLTQGKMKLVKWQFYPVPGIQSDRDFLHLVGCLQSQSEHPIAKSLVNSIKSLGVSEFSESVSDFRAVIGQGVTGLINGIPCVIGNAVLLANSLVSISSSCVRDASEQESLGRTVVFMAYNGSLAGYLALSDVLKQDAISVVSILKQMNIGVAMVTGDQEAPARKMADEAGIDEVYACVSPAGKKALVEQMQAAGHVIAMIGDGINDSACLAQSDMGIAVFGGTDIAIEAASVVLMRPELSDVVVAIDLSRAIFKRIWTNFVWASMYNIVMIPLAMGAGAPFGFTLPTMVSGIAMSLSSVSVVVSSLLLKRYKRPVLSKFQVQKSVLWSLKDPSYLRVSSSDDTIDMTDLV